VRGAALSFYLVSTVDQQVECPPPPKSGPRVCFLADVMTTRGRFGGFWDWFLDPQKAKSASDQARSGGTAVQKGGRLVSSSTTPSKLVRAASEALHILCRKRRPIRASDQKRKAISISCQKQKKRFGIDRSDLVAEAKVDPKPCPLNPDSYPFICKSENLNPKP
jgi:hypothetical protein